MSDAFKRLILITSLFSLSAYAGVIRQGVRHISESGDIPLVGDVTLSEGSNITLTQVGQNIAISATAGGAASSGFEPETFTLDGGVTFVTDINGIRRAENNKTIQRIVTCLYDSGSSGETFVKVNYGPALAAAVTMSVTANNSRACNSINPAISLVTNDLMNVDVTGTANGAPTDLSVKLIF